MVLRKFIKSLIFHPYLFLLSIILSLYTDNIGQVYFWETYRSYWVSFIVVTFLLVLCTAILRSWPKGGVLASVFILLSFSYDSAFHIASKSRVENPLIIVLVAMGICIWVFFSVVITCFRIQKPFDTITRIFNLTSIAFLIITISTLCIKYMNYQWKSTLVKYERPGLISNLVDRNSTNLVKRDVYYIILDGYTREDVLNELYGLDTSEFLQNLEHQGFMIADQSSSNYAQTLLSLSSTLNMKYLPNLMELDKETYSREPVIKLIENNEVMRLFKAMGYRLVMLQSGYTLLSLREVDIFVPRKHQINAFEGELIPSPWGGIVNIQKYNLALFREDQLDQFENLQRIIDEPGPKFVFSHFLMPHPPFILDQHGKPLPAEKFQLNDGSHFTEGKEAYRSGYREQVLFVEKKIQEVITKILSSYPEGSEPIIILQGDHGSGMYLDWGSYEESCARERLSILNAFYLPDGGQEALYPNISPVNTFRVILNQYFHTELELLPDNHFFSIWQRPYDFIPVSEDTLRQPCETGN